MDPNRTAYLVFSNPADGQDEAYNSWYDEVHVPEVLATPGVVAAQRFDVHRPAGAVGGVRIEERQGDLYVVPDEAVGLLGAEKLDPRLFDVTDLIEMGYDDAGTGQVPMIATYTNARARSVMGPSAPRGSRLVRRLPSVHAAALTAAKPQVRTFWTALAPKPNLSDPTPTLRDGVAKLWLDGRVQANLHESVPQIGAPEAWAAGYDGTGVKVALLDTGVDVTHPDLATQVDDTASFVPGEGTADVNGHGTHVASTIVGTGAASDGFYRGVAPGAHLIVGKVLGGVEGFGQDSWVMAGMEWAAQSGAKVVSMSLGDTTPSDGSDPLSQEVDALSAQYGTLFVIAAGNAGPETISSPGAAASALTVGAVDKEDGLASFSATGPLTKSGALKPDLVAPGVDITAARSSEMTDGGTGPYRTLSGTSMATPHVSGSAAILAEEHPGWTGEQLKEQLMSTAKGLADGYSPYEIGTGRVDVAAAVRSTVRSTGSAFFGNYLWPHGPSEVPVTHDLTFTNDGAQDVTLDLALNATGGAFSLGESSVTVPAGGKAVVPVTGDPQAAAIGRDVGWVVGTDRATGATVTRTSVALLKEDERYDLHVSLVGRDGQPASTWVAINQIGDPLGPWAEFVDGEKTLRLPPGDYSLMTFLDTQGEAADRSGLAALIDPETSLHQSADVTLDARQARLVQTKAPERTEDRQRKVDMSIVDDQGLEFRQGYVVPPNVDDIYVSPTDPMSQGSFMLTTRTRQGEPMLSLGTPDGKLRFATVTQPGSHIGTRTDTVPTVYAGAGTPEDYQDLGLRARDTIVVVERSAAVSAQQRADAAAAAGVLGLVVVNDGVGALDEYATSRVPIASVHRDAGAGLIALAKAGRRLTFQQVAYTPYVYDLTREYAGQVPDRPLVYRPARRDLARIDARYYAVRPEAAAGYRYDVTLSPSLGFDERERHPRTRVEWVTPGQKWVESHAQNITGALPWPMVAGTDSYRRGTTTRLDWFRPAIRPGFSPSFGVFNSRWQNFMTWNVQDWSSSSNRLRLGGFMPWGETPTHLRVYQGRHLIHTNKFSSDMQFKEVPAGNRPYRVVLDARRPASVFRLSTRTHTEWRFMSDTVDSDNFVSFPVLKLDYDLETGLTGDVRAGAKQRIAIRPSSSTFAALPGRLTHVTLDVSANDGRSWHRVTLHAGGHGWWRGAFTAPERRGSFISVRADATMNSGYSIKQTIIRAYGVR